MTTVSMSDLELTSVISSDFLSPKIDEHEPVASDVDLSKIEIPSVATSDLQISIEATPYEFYAQLYKSWSQEGAEIIEMICNNLDPKSVESIMKSADISGAFDNLDMTGTISMPETASESSILASEVSEPSQEFTNQSGCFPSANEEESEEVEERMNTAEFLPYAEELLQTKDGQTQDDINSAPIEILNADYNILFMGIIDGEMFDSVEFAEEKVQCEDTDNWGIGGGEIEGEREKTGISADSNSGIKNDGDEQSGEEKSGDEKSGDEKSGEEKSGEEKSGEEKSGEEKSGDEKSGEEKSRDEKSGEEKSGDEKSGDENSNNEKSGDESSGEQDINATQGETIEEPNDAFVGNRFEEIRDIGNAEQNWQEGSKGNPIDLTIFDQTNATFKSTQRTDETQSAGLANEQSLQYETPRKRLQSSSRQRKSNWKPQQKRKRLAHSTDFEDEDDEYRDRSPRKTRKASPESSERYSSSGNRNKRKTDSADAEVKEQEAPDQTTRKKRKLSPVKLKRFSLRYTGEEYGDIVKAIQEDACELQTLQKKGNFTDNPQNEELLEDLLECVSLEDFVDPNRMTVEYHIYPVETILLVFRHFETDEDVLLLVNRCLRRTEEITNSYCSEED